MTLWINPVVSLPIIGSPIPGRTNLFAPRLIIEIPKPSTPGDPAVICVALLPTIRIARNAPTLATDNSVR
jgi:hypothetical protein